MRVGNKFSFALLFTFGIILSGCFKDDCDRLYTMYLPVYKTLTQVRAEMKSSQPQALSQTGKLYVYGQYIFLNEVNKGIHVIDNANPAQPKNISFIPVPGNVDLAVKGGYLYADSYSDLVVFDISNPTSVTPKKFVTDVFPERKVFYASSSSNPDSIRVVVGYVEKDTTVSCQTYRMWYDNCPSCASMQGSGGRVFFSAAAAAAPSGRGGSMARFALVNNYLYTVSTYQLYTFDISAATDPQLLNKSSILNTVVETIFPFRDKLFIGSTNGMFIYDISNAANPSKMGQFSHVRSCDPVIADDKYAYVTLRSGTQCQGFTNQLEVLDIADLMQPKLVRTYALTNPHGLAKDGELLFLCDGKDGLKVYDATNVNNLVQLAHITGLETYDVITLNDIALVVATDGLYQFDYRDPKNIRQVSKISISK